MRFGESAYSCCPPCLYGALDIPPAFRANAAGYGGFVYKAPAADEAFRAWPGAFAFGDDAGDVLEAGIPAAFLGCHCSGRGALAALYFAVAVFAGAHASASSRMAYPCFQVREHTRRLAEAEVSPPTDKIRGEVFDDLFQAASAGPAGHIPDFHLELVEGLGRDAPLNPIVRDGKKCIS
jgi:hypothetical protein